MGCFGSNVGERLRVIQIIEDSLICLTELLVIFLFFFFSFFVVVPLRLIDLLVLHGGRVFPGSSAITFHWMACLNMPSSARRVIKKLLTQFNT